MRKFECMLIAIGIAYGSIDSSAAPGEKGQALPAHLEQSECATCHLAGSKANPENAHILVGTEKAICTSCHEKAVRLSHRSGFRAKAVAPLVYPLNWKGELVCSTCHHIHAPPGKMLRGVRRGKDFCLMCHQPSFFSNLATGGLRILLSAHESASAELLRHELDPASMECLRCHSALQGKYEVFVDPSLVARHANDVPYDHPIGRPYRSSLGLGLRPNKQQTSGAQMVQGRLSCLSCHRKDGQPHGKVLLPIKKEKLCKECHDFK